MMRALLDDSKFLCAAFGASKDGYISDHKVYFKVFRANSIRPLVNNIFRSDRASDDGVQGRWPRRRVSGGRRFCILLAVWEEREIRK